MRLGWTPCTRMSKPSSCTATWPRVQRQASVGSRHLFSAGRPLEATSRTECPQVEPLLGQWMKSTQRAAIRAHSHLQFCENRCRRHLSSGTPGSCGAGWTQLPCILCSQRVITHEICRLGLFKPMVCRRQEHNNDSHHAHPARRHARVGVGCAVVWGVGCECACVGGECVCVCGCVGGRAGRRRRRGLLANRPCFSVSRFDYPQVFLCLGSAQLFLCIFVVPSSAPPLLLSTQT